METSRFKFFFVFLYLLLFWDLPCSLHNSKSISYNKMTGLSFNYTKICLKAVFETLPKTLRFSGKVREASLL